MRAEAAEIAQSHLDRYAQRCREQSDIDPELVIREGLVADEILEFIEEDQDIAFLVLAASESSEGPGPLVSSISGRTSPFPIPVVVVPGLMSDEDIISIA